MLRLRALYYLNELGDSTAQAIAVGGPLLEDAKRVLGRTTPPKVHRFPQIRPTSEGGMQLDKVALPERRELTARGSQKWKMGDCEPKLPGHRSIRIFLRGDVHGDHPANTGSDDPHRAVWVALKTWIELVNAAPDTLLNLLAPPAAQAGV